MNRVLIVDDESMSREGLSSIFLTHKPAWSVAALLHDGQEALHYLQEGNTVDLIVTDIRMPKIGGLELIAKIREVDPTVLIIIVSGYAEFEYAKRAIDLRVYDYVLKPIKESEFHKIITRIENTLLIIKDEITDIKIAPEDKRYFCDLLFSDAIELNDLDYISRLEKLLSISLRHFCFVVLEDRSNSNIIQLRKRLETFLDRKSKSYAVFTFKQQMVCAAISNISLAEAATIVMDLRQSIAMGGLSAGIAPCPDPHQLSEAFSNAICALRQNYYDSVPSVVCYCGRKQANIPKSIMDKLEFDLFSVDILSSRDDVYDLFDYIRRNKPDFNALESWVAQVYGAIMKFIQLHQIPSNSFTDTFFKLKSLYIYSTIEDIENELLSLLDAVLTFSEQITRAGTKRIIKQVQQYIQEHYMENISLSGIADVLNVNYNYLSTIYKSTTDENMVDYLTNLRMNKAKELLLTTKLKVKEISEQIGYSDSKYFIKRFRQMLGVTPIEYRKLNKN